MRKGCASPGVFGFSSTNRSKSSAFAPFMGFGSSILRSSSLVLLQAPDSGVGACIADRRLLLLVIPLNAGVVKGDGLLRFSPAASTYGDGRDDAIGHGVSQIRIERAIFILPNNDFHRGQRLGLIAIVNQAGGSQIQVLGDGKVLMVGAS